MVRSDRNHVMFTAFLHPPEWRLYNTLECIPSQSRNPDDSDSVFAMSDDPRRIPED